ncbi:secondary thiamine-phosphate synthase enzyme YjbQ [Anaerotalea alkaliphila]|uniref:YjbQ family protein n=1 Tax=Anaerotalea alkaliphila TaxID=2662126 RepID=A0A7X5HWQ1_9FIRM|nr:secondary thiamine-phosphate synthase enzyme YjbQ [Anaerotalea alkaliphila]NDL68032.1 YjbQ family protein [Anaerotalea alkaliphila]
MLKEIPVITKHQIEMTDITVEVNALVKESGVQEGICIVFVPHTTAGITINENADPDVKKDMVKELNKIVPFEDNYKHFEGNSAAHLKASFMGFSQTLIIHGGHLLRGTWQGLYFCEFDGPRHRKVHVKIQETR